MVAAAVERELRRQLDWDYNVFSAAVEGDEVLGLEDCACIRRWLEIVLDRGLKLDFFGQELKLLPLAPQLSGSVRLKLVAVSRFPTWARTMLLARDGSTNCLTHLGWHSGLHSGVHPPAPAKWISFG